MSYLKNVFLSVLVFVLMTFSCKFHRPVVEPDGPGIIFYEGNNAINGILCVLDPPARKSTGDQQNVYELDFTSHTVHCPNDDARSVVLKEIKAGVRIFIYDDSSCTRNDSATLIVVKRDLARKVVASFERSFSDADVRVSILRGGNLDGKVSCVALGWW